MIAQYARNFILLCLQGMKDKLPFQNEELLDASVVYFGSEQFERSKWEKLGKKYTNVILDKDYTVYIHELDQLECNYGFYSRQIGQPRSNPIDIWSSMKTSYPLCSSLAYALFVLPHSTVSVERIFSSMKDIKTFKRNRLSRETLEACLLGYQSFKGNEMKIRMSMVKRYQDVWRKTSDGDFVEISKVKDMEFDKEDIMINEENLRIADDQAIEEPNTGGIGQKRKHKEPLERDFKQMKKSDFYELDENPKDFE